ECEQYYKCVEQGGSCQPKRLTCNGKLTKDCKDNHCLCCMPPGTTIPTDECTSLSPPGFWIPFYQNSPPCPEGSIDTGIARPGGICCQPSTTSTTPLPTGT
ncbi:unnamed protein product, partial [Meganyctiphanes norvegica]